jgi:hypothetical protein
MRKTALLLAGLLIFSTAAFAATAATGATGDMGKGTTAATGDKGMEKGKAMPGKTVSYSGETSNVKEADKTFTVTGKDGGKNFTWNDTTKVTPKGAKLEDGQNVTVRYSSGTQEPYLAKSVAVHKKKAAKADKKM